MKTLLGILVGLAFGSYASATVRYFHWDKPHHGDRGNVTALDLSSGKVVWEASPAKSVNFVQETGGGVVVGNDEGEVVLLNKDNGKVIWRCRLEKKAEIKSLISNTDEGFFVSSGDSFYWLVSRDGKLLLRCNDTCTAPK
jgi:outer membrane protein assembly factor BamB